MDPYLRNLPESTGRHVAKDWPVLTPPRRKPGRHVGAEEES